MAVSINNAFYPVLSSMVNEPKKAVKVEIKQLSLVTGVAIALSTFTFVFAGFITVIFSKEFTQSIGILRLLALSIPSRFANSALATILTSLGMQRKRTVIIGVGSAFSILLNLVLIPLLNYNGASISVLLTEITLFVLLLIAYLKCRAQYLRSEKVFSKALNKLSFINLTNVNKG